MKGYFGIGIDHPKHEVNVGTLWRTAQIFGAAFVFTVGRRYKAQASDTIATPHHVPLFHFTTVVDLIEHLPWSAPLVGVELDENATPIERFRHPDRAVYLLGAEDHGLTTDALSRCHYLTQLPGYTCMNVAAAGSILLYDRWRTGRRELALLRRAS